MVLAAKFLRQPTEITNRKSPKATDSTGDLDMTTTTTDNGEVDFLGRKTKWQQKS